MEYVSRRACRAHQEDGGGSMIPPKQKEQLEACNKVLNNYIVRVRINCIGAGINYPISVDVEHDEQGNLVCIGMYDNTTREAHIWTKVNDFVKQCLEKAILIMHNGVSDIEALRSWGINIKDEQLVHDTMLLGHILDSSKKSYGLKDMAERELGISYPYYEDIVGKHKGKTKDKPKCPQTEIGCCGRITLDKQPIELVAAYNACDVVSTWLLAQKQKKETPDYAL